MIRVYLYKKTLVKWYFYSRYCSQNINNVGTEIYENIHLDFWRIGIYNIHIKIIYIVGKYFINIWFLEIVLFYLYHTVLFFFSYSSCFCYFLSNSKAIYCLFIGIFNFYNKTLHVSTYNIITVMVMVMVLTIISWF